MSEIRLFTDEQVQAVSRKLERDMQATFAGISAAAAKAAEEMNARGKALVEALNRPRGGSSSSR